MKHAHLAFIDGIERLVAIYGDEVCFHDAEVRRLEFNVTDGRVALMLDVALPHGMVTLIFDDVEDVRFDGFNQQNALFDLTIEKSESLLRVAVNPAYGLGGEFTCSRARVADGSQHV